MSKQRMLDTSFWEDKYVENLDPSEKLLFLYFLTNPQTDLSGIYEISLKRISFETGFEKEMVLKVLERFERDGKVFYIDGYVVLKNFIKHQKLNPNIEIGIKRAFEALPAEIWLKIQENESLYKAFESLWELKPKLKPNLNLTKPNLNMQPAVAEEIEIVEKEKNEVNQVMEIFYKINPTLNWGNKTERKSVEEIITKLGFEKTMRMTEYAISIQGQQFAPTITKPTQLKNKIAELGIYWKKNNQSSQITDISNL